eukprot:m.232258 g.232258  ORF g.232258 m.232258 type:complete len:73 (+) comp17075_c2_seq1:999-1217(+)
MAEQQQEKEQAIGNEKRASSSTPKAPSTHKPLTPTVQQTAIIASLEERKRSLKAQRDLAQKVSAELYPVHHY